MRKPKKLYDVIRNVSLQNCLRLKNSYLKMEKKFSRSPSKRLTDKEVDLNLEKMSNNKVQKIFKNVTLLSAVTSRLNKKQNLVDVFAYSSFSFKKQGQF